MNRSAPLSSTFGPDASTGLRVGGGVAGIAEASVAPSAAAGAGFGDFMSLDSAATWVGIYTAAAIAWLLWVRFVFRGAAL